MLLLCVYIDEYWINCPRLYFAFVLTLGIIMFDRCSLYAFVGLYRAINFSLFSHQRSCICWLTYFKVVGTNPVAFNTKIVPKHGDGYVEGFFLCDVYFT